MRRHTLTGDEARAKAEGLRSGGKQRLAREREKFLDLLKSRYPEQADAIASELEWGGKTSNKPERREGQIIDHKCVNNESKLDACHSIDRNDFLAIRW